VYIIFVWANVKDFYFSKACDMGYKSVNSGSDIYMSFRIFFENLLSNENILMKVMSLRCSRVVSFIVKARVVWKYFEIFGLFSFYLYEISDVSKDVFCCTYEIEWITSELS
jgi:hypothetical protein